MSRYTCEDFRRDHRFFCNEFAPILAAANTENDQESGNPIENRQFSRCCRMNNDERGNCSGRHHHRS